jgi:hypothetical protein
MQLRHAFAPSIHRCRQQRAPVVRLGTQPPPRSKAPAPAPNRCHPQLLGHTQTGELVRFAPRASKPRRRSRSGSLGQGCGWHTTQSAVGFSMRSRRELTPPTHRGRQQCAPAAAATLQGADSGSGSEPMLPPTAQPKRDRCLSRRRRLRAAAGVEAAPVQTGRLVRGNCGKHAAPAQSRGSSGKRVPPTNRPGLRRAQHAAAHSARATTAPLPPEASARRVTRQAATAALQGSGSGSEPMPPPPAAGPTHADRRLVTSPPPSYSTRRRSRAGTTGQPARAAPRARVPR